MFRVSSVVLLLACFVLSASAYQYKPYHPPPPSRCGEKCGYHGLKCKQGLKCKDGMCIKKKGEHEKCGGRNGCKKCKYPFKCINGFCRLKSVKCGEKCFDHGIQVAKCRGNKSCMNGICAVKKELGKKCDSTCRFCKSPYICENGHCQLKTAKCGEKCFEHGITVAKCKGNKSCMDGICAVKKELGKKCDSTCRFCKFPYICENGHCQLKTAKCGEKCSEHGITVAKCKGNKSCMDGICAVKKGLHKKCDSKCRFCKHPYVCEHGTCQLPTAKCGETCAEHGKVVAKCAGNKKCINGKCAIKKGKWEHCDGSCKLCKNHLHCFWGKCVPRKYW